MDRRSFLTAIVGAGLASAGCTQPVVRRGPHMPISPDPRGGVLVVVDAGRARFGPVFIGAQSILGAVVTLSHAVVLLPPGRQLIVAYDDDSYDAAEAEVYPNAVYAMEVEHTDGELELHPLVPSRDPIARLLDETDRVELAHVPHREEQERFERKLRLARLRYSDYSPGKRAARALTSAHIWR